MSKEKPQNPEVQETEAGTKVTVEDGDKKVEVEVKDADNQQESEDEEAAAAQEEDALSELNDKYLRLLAEFENFKRRTAKEKVELRKTAAQDVIGDLLTVLDDFDRAEKAASEAEQKGEDASGYHLIANKMRTILQGKGLKAMDSQGNAFDPEFHEAITEIPSPTPEMKGKVVDVVEVGYLLGDKIIRHARVVVGK